jgi:hypothetical protein
MNENINQPRNTLQSTKTAKQASWESCNGDLMTLGSASRRNSLKLEQIDGLAPVAFIDRRHIYLNVEVPETNGSAAYRSWFENRFQATVPTNISVSPPTSLEHDKKNETIERKLQLFDLDSIIYIINEASITRIERWKRAQKFKLDPPPEIFLLLNDPVYLYSMWN